METGPDQRDGAGFYGSPAYIIAGVFESERHHDTGAKVFGAAVISALSGEGWQVVHAPPSQWQIARGYASAVVIGALASACLILPFH